MATHSSTLAWKIPQLEEPGRLQSMRSQRVGPDWVTSLSLIITVLQTRKIKREEVPLFAYAIVRFHARFVWLQSLHLSILATSFRLLLPIEQGCWIHPITSWVHTGAKSTPHRPFSSPLITPGSSDLFTALIPPFRTERTFHCRLIFKCFILGQ